MKLRKKAGSKNKSVSVRSNPKSTLRSLKERRQRFLIKVGTVLFVLIVLAGTGYGSFVYLKNILFVKNPRYTISKIEVQSSGAFSVDRFKEYTKIKEGDNMYSFKLKDVENLFKHKIPNVKEIEIRRQLPDALMVKIMERTPVLRLSRGSNLCVDRNGYIFFVFNGSKLKFLPYISGYEYVSLSPGGKLTGRSLSAVKLVNLGVSGMIDLPITNVNISQEDYIIVFLNNGKKLNIAWNGMDDNSEDSLEELETKLMRFVVLLNSPQGKALYNFSAIDDSFYGR